MPKARLVANRPFLRRIRRSLRTTGNPVLPGGPCKVRREGLHRRWHCSSKNCDPELPGYFST